MTNRAFNVSADLTKVPEFAQTQNSLGCQLEALRVVANRLGLYDAADFIKRSK
jgi:hypothetical protein